MRSYVNLICLDLSTKPFPFSLFFSETSFKGTVFWFPLRQKPSPLSETVYTQERVRHLKKALRSESSTLLLFLKRIERLEVFSHDGDLQSSAPVLDFSVGLSAECLETVRHDRDEFLSAITTPDKACPRKEVQCFFKFFLLHTQYSIMFGMSIPVKTRKRFTVRVLYKGVEVSP